MTRRNPSRRDPRYKLLVEGDEDKRVIPQLIEQNGIRWGEAHEEPLVSIESYGGIENLLAQGEISTQVKSSGLEALGILVDADENLEQRWQQLRRECLRSFPDLPSILPAAGLLHSHNGIRLGVWVMPDNQSVGMLETFLSYLVPDSGNRLLEFARQSHTLALEHGATFKHAHADKALIHTWLAWQDPPGSQMHQAILARILHPASPKGAAFLRWFCELYRVESKA